LNTFKFVAQLPSTLGSLHSAIH